MAYGKDNTTFTVTFTYIHNIVNGEVLCNSNKVQCKHVDTKVFKNTNLHNLCMMYM